MWTILAMLAAVIVLTAVLYIALTAITYRSVSDKGSAGPSDWDCHL
jgi:hypothetical protein